VENKESSSLYNLDQAIIKFSAEMGLPLEVYKKILLASLNPAQNDLMKLDQALQAQDWEQIHLLSHRLKGTYSNLRLEDLSALAARMDELARAKSNIEEIIELSFQFNNIFVRLRKALEAL
jgi:HPt (histidine-containing phosphotransfer) domain-containing protein